MLITSLQLKKFQFSWKKGTDCRVERTCDKYVLGVGSVLSVCNHKQYIPETPIIAECHSFAIEFLSESDIPGLRST
jgi:hypothetical protein